MEKHTHTHRQTDSLTHLGGTALTCCTHPRKKVLVQCAVLGCVGVYDCVCMYTSVLCEKYRVCEKG